MNHLASQLYPLVLLLVISSRSLDAQNFMVRGYPLPGSELASGDFNEDGIPDIMKQTATGVSVMLGTPQGTLGAVKSSLSSVTGVGTLALARFTGADHLDVALSHQSFGAIGQR